MTAGDAWVLVAASAIALGSCGPAGSPGGGPPTATAPVVATPSPCPAASLPTVPRGATQALSVISVEVVAGLRAAPRPTDLGISSCVEVGVGQTVALHVRARIPPWPAESRASSPRLSAITVTPPVPSSTAASVAGEYTLTFTTLAAGSTSITYLAGACNLPPGVC